LAWVTRSTNTVKKLVAPNSPSLILAEEALGISTSGFYPLNFEKVKSTILKSLETTVSISREDSYDELRNVKSESKSSYLSNRVFIVHARDGVTNE
jgi:hypothetical protein